MFINLSKILFFFMLLLGTMISVSANSWFGVWMGLEINLLSFIPLITMKNNLNNSEASLNYFLIQAFGSTVILFSMIIYLIFMNLNFFLKLNNYLFNFLNFLPLLLISFTLMLKIGVAPFHFWFPNVMENISWLNNLILMTWQKFAPLMIISYLVNLNMLFMIFVIMSTFIGAIGGLNQTSLRKLMAFSSINHMGWMIGGMMFNENLWLMYFLIYMFMNFSLLIMFKMFQVFYLSQMYSMFMNSYMLKIFLLMSMLSLGGLPPFLGFIPKWMIIQSFMFMKMNFINLFIICMSLITLFYYLKIMYAAFLMNYNEFNWNYKNFYNNNNFIFMINLNFISLFSFFFFINIMY